jgi:hypothetical protein
MPQSEKLPSSSWLLTITGHQKCDEDGMLIVVEMIRKAYPTLDVSFMSGDLALKRI